MSAPPKLTKKQKKGIAFRDRKTTKSRAHGASVEDNEVPVLEVQDLADVEGDSPAPAVDAATKKGASKESRKGKEKASDAIAPPPAQKKRKRDQAVVEGQADAPEQSKEGEVEGPKRKKAKGASGAPEDPKVKAVQSQVKQRFILFVGNLKYTTTADAIKAHFAACDPPPTVRLRTPKPAAPGRPVNKSKGCAFVEFSHRNALQQGLKLHQSELEGRRINVELTVGGGGKSDARLDKLKERNKGLFEQRKDRVEKLAKSDPSLSTVPDLPQRFSATSGLEQVQSKRRTWTVGDEDDGETHRGGQKHIKGKGRSQGKQWGTGVNAIPVG